MPTRVLVTFDKFKDALSAEQACATAAAELQRVHPDWEVRRAPLTDGGDGFCRILTQKLGGEVRMHSATGPLLQPVQAPVGLVETDRLPAAVTARLFAGRDAKPGRLAVIEMAAVNGLALLPAEKRDPWQATSIGTGELILAAAGMGAGAVLLGVGGSATSDLGLGALQALGLEFADATGTSIRPPIPAQWHRVASIRGTVSPRVPPVIIACDVSNPLLGPTGAAAVFGPQKGMRPGDLPRHEALASRLAALLCARFAKDPAVCTGAPGAGAAGGISFGLTTAAGARLVPGFELVADWLDLACGIRWADIVITGEGRFDGSSLTGKGPGGVVQRACAAGKRTVVFAGALETPGEAGNYETVAITPTGTALARALLDTQPNLAASVARHFASG